MGGRINFSTDFALIIWLVMVKHAILLTTREWCEAAAEGRTSIFDFYERKKPIKALGPGSVCVLMVKAERGRPQSVYGEFRVVEVREVDAEEYARLANQGLIFRPQPLKAGEKRWIILFEGFRKYGREVPKSELKDVYTATSSKPVSEWVIQGVSYIDDRALEAIKRRAGVSVVVSGVEERLRGKRLTPTAKKNL